VEAEERRADECRDELSRQSPCDDEQERRRGDVEQQVCEVICEAPPARQRHVQGFLCAAHAWSPPPVAILSPGAPSRGAIRILPRMPLAEWLQAFRALHERARSGSLSPDDRSAYLAGREELARALVAAQQLTVTPGMRPREALRVARALQVDLETPLSRERATTMTLSIGGFSALLAKAPRPDEALKCTLRIPGGDSIETTARPVGTKPQPGSVHVSFAFGKLGEAERERLELLIFDTVLAQLAR